MKRRDFIRKTSLSIGTVWAASEFVQSAKALVDMNEYRPKEVRKGDMVYRELGKTGEQSHWSVWAAITSAIRQMKAKASRLSDPLSIEESPSWTTVGTITGVRAKFAWAGLFKTVTEIGCSS